MTTTSRAPSVRAGQTLRCRLHGPTLSVGALLATACLTAGPRRPDAQGSPTLRPEAFFAGHTRGEGTVARRGQSPQALRVDGEGRREADGSFRLDQTLTIGDAPPETRTWRLRRVDERHYTATLSDARGPVVAEVDGNRFHLRYEIRRPDVVMEQWLYLQPDGRTVRNIATVSVLGVAWVRLAENITRTEVSTQAF